MIVTRRKLIGGIAAAGGSLGGCDKLGGNPGFRKILFSAEDAHRFLQRSLTDRMALAREYRPDQMSPVFRTNGTNNPGTPEYQAHADSRFANWRLQVGGLAQKRQQMIAFTEDARHLVHHAARRTDDEVLDLLTEQRFVMWFDTDVERCGDCFHHSDFESG